MISLKKKLVYLVCFILLFIGIGFLEFLKNPENLSEEKEIPKEEKEETIIEKQLKELERLRENTQPLTEEEIKKQMEELERLRQEQKPLSQQEIQKQLEELEKMR